MAVLLDVSAACLVVDVAIGLGELDEEAREERVLHSNPVSFTRVIFSNGLKDSDLGI